MVASTGDIADIEAQVGDLLSPLNQRVAVVVNYDNFQLAPELVGDYSAMVARLKERYYSGVTRYGAGGFLKARLEGGG